jgi:hypothetical protein
MSTYITLVSEQAIPNVQYIKELADKMRSDEIKKQSEEASLKLKALEEEIRKNAKQKSLPEPNPEIKKVFGPLRTYLGKEKIAVPNSDLILNLLIESYKLVSKPREKQEWEKELPKFLKEYLGEGQNIEDWLIKIFGK